MGAYAKAAPAWIAAGVVPLPLGGVDGKRPLIRNPARLGRRAALDLASRPRFADVAGLGFWCGARNSLTVVDIDSTSDAVLQHAIDTYGDTPIIVQTASGKAHLYYNYNGERRRIRPDKDYPIDILGEGGLAVAPPSERPGGGYYQFVRGGLDDFRLLPVIRTGVIAQVELAHVRRPDAPLCVMATGAEPGNRNETLFRLALKMANMMSDCRALLEVVREVNAGLLVPLPDHEILGLVRSVWRYRQEGRLLVRGIGESTLILPASIADYTMATGNADVAALMLMVRKYHSEPGKTFALSPVALAAVDKIKGWGPNRYRYAIRDAVNLGLLVQVHMGGRGRHDPSLYKLRLRVL